MHFTKSMNNKPLIAKLLSGGVWVFAGRLIMSLAALGVTSLITRMVDADSVAAYFLATSMVLVFSLLAQMGMDKTIVRFVAEAVSLGQQQDAIDSIKKVFLIGVLSSVVTYIVTYGFIGKWIAINVFNSQVLNSIVPIVSLWIVLFTFQRLLAEAFRGWSSISSATIFGGVASNVIAACLMLYLWWIEAPTSLYDIMLCVIYGLMVNITIAVFVLCRFLLRVAKMEHDIHRAYKFGEIINTSTPLLLVGLLDVVLSQADLWLLGFLRPSADVALYGAAVRLIIFVAMPLMIVNAVVQPWIARLYVTNRKKDLENVLRTAALVAGIPSASILLLLVVFGEIILRIIFGEFYQQASNVLWILAIGRLVNVWTGSCGMLLSMTGNHVVLMKITAISAVVMAILLLVCTKYWGLVGCAVAASSSMAIYNISMLLVAKRRTHIWTQITFNPQWQLLKSVKEH